MVHLQVNLLPILRCSLQESDRETLRSAASKASTHATIGSLIGVGLGLALAFRLRQNRVKTFQAFRAAERPTHVQFAGGRTGQRPVSSIPRWSLLI